MNRKYRSQRVGGKKQTARTLAKQFAYFAGFARISAMAFKRSFQTAQRRKKLRALFAQRRDVGPSRLSGTCAALNRVLSARPMRSFACASARGYAMRPLVNCTGAANLHGAQRGANNLHFGGKTRSKKTHRKKARSARPIIFSRFNGFAARPRKLP